MLTTSQFKINFFTMKMKRYLEPKLWYLGSYSNAPNIIISTNSLGIVFVYPQQHCICPPPLLPHQSLPHLRRYYLARSLNCLGIVFVYPQQHCICPPLLLPHHSHSLNMLIRFAQSRALFNSIALTSVSNPLVTYLAISSG